MSARTVVTGDRATRKVRATVARYPELGALRHVEANTPPVRAYVVTVLVVVAFCAGVVLGNGDVVDALVVAPAWVAIAATILWFIGSEKVLVLENGLVVGSFAPFLRPYVVPFGEVDAWSVQAVDRFARLGRMAAGQGLSSTGRGALWSRSAVVFVGPSAVVARRHRARVAGTLDVPEPSVRGGTLWWFATRGRPDRLVHALAAAMVAAGVPGGDGVAARALPPTVLTGRPEDAAVQLPGLAPRGR
ncbi:hypothetical protein [Cellulosimicrobium marinum]|uniref:hypothetical protein n=1 Tax=Cellulosimicrobium marinum TaxID=1638992 RepID=UPI001E2DB8F7|nr:hypothetical protein [Cellulosimicrobium marinum]MCB7135734.1 hypothetical protein [Cellulosimicrobium marinum]